MSACRREPTRAIASLGAGPQRALLRLARRTIEPYARRHGYDLALHEQIVDSTRPAPWSKVRILRELVDRYETVVWLDADVEIVDGRRDIADELRADSFLGLVEHRYDGVQLPNTGVMVLRGGEASARFLDEVWSCDQYIEHEWWENAAVCELLGYALDPPRPTRSTPWLEQTTMLAPCWNWILQTRQPAARIRHFPGFAVSTRAALMSAAIVEAYLRRGVRRG